MNKFYLFLSIIIFWNFSVNSQTSEQSISSLRFNGSGAKVVVPDTSLTNITSGSWGAWVKFDGFNSTYQRIIYKIGVVELFYYEPARRFVAEIVVGGPRYSVFTDSTTLPIDTGVWYHLMATYDTLDFKLYVNGTLLATNSNPEGNILDNSGSWGIGASASSGAWSFNGEIDEVTIWNTALDSADISGLFCSQISASYPKYSNLVAYYKFDENSGTEAFDEMGGKTGTLTSNPVWVNNGMPYFVPTLIIDNTMLTSSISGTSYQWYKDGAVISGANNQSYTALETGNYYVEVSNDFNCSANSDTTSIYILTPLGQQSTSALNFNGSGAKVVVPDTSLTNITSGSWGAWVKFDAFSSTYQRIIYKIGNVELFYYEPARRFVAEIVVGGPRYSVFTDSTTLPIDTGIWYHLMATYDTLDFKLYVDGTLMATNSNPEGKISDNSGAWGIGASATSGAWSFNGEIDEVTIWNTALDSIDISGLLCSQISASYPKYSNLVAYYKFDENSGTEAFDEVGGKTGILTSNPVWVNSGMPYFKPSLIVNGYTLTSNILGTNYIWFQDGIEIIGATEQSYIATETADYYVQVTGGNDCVSNSDTVYVIVTSSNNISFSEEIKVYPIPSDGVFNFDFNSIKKQINVSIFSINGQEVYNADFNNTSRLSLKLNQPKGIYIAQISISDELKKHIKLIIE